MADFTLSYTGTQINTLLAKIDNLLNNIYPVGSIYMSVNSTNPGTLFGGTWQQIQDTFLLAAGSTYTAGGTGGNAAHTHTYEHTHTTPATTTDSHTLSVTEMPSHTHEVKGVSWAGDLGISITRPGATDADSTWYAIQDYSHDTNYHYSTTAGSNSSLYAVARGGGGGHTHGQKATTTDSQSTSTTSETSNLPPYLAIYVWKRIA